MVVYLRKGDYLPIGAFVDGKHFKSASCTISDRKVFDTTPPPPPGWKKGYRPGVSIRALSKGESVITFKAKSWKTDKDSVLKLRVIVEE